MANNSNTKIKMQCYKSSKLFLSSSFNSQISFSHTVKCLFVIAILNSTLVNLSNAILNNGKNQSSEISTKGLISMFNSSHLNFQSNSNSGGVRFYLYNDPLRYHLEAGEELKLSNLQAMLSLNLRRDRSVKFLIHGYVHNYTCWFPQEIKDTYFERGYEENIIAVDWGPLATPPPVSAFADYFFAVKNVPAVAKEMTNFISVLRTHHLIGNLSSVHLIGFSLGAHIAGIVGKDLNDIFSEKIGRITGLDPAGPLFHTGLVARRIRKSDATYVDIVHTDVAEYGIIGPAGHADFYVNGGRPPQPGCRGNASCSHAAASNYFIQSIGNNDYLGCECASYEFYLNGLCKCLSGAPFGENSQTGTNGTFYLKMKPIPLSGRYTC